MQTKLLNSVDVLCFCRIVGFVDAWPKLEKWFTKFGILQRVDANSGEGKTYIHTLFRFRH